MNNIDIAKLIINLNLVLAPILLLNFILSACILVKLYNNKENNNIDADR